jgi:hypothetical protein
MTAWLHSATDIWVPAVLVLPDAAMVHPRKKFHDHTVYAIGANTWDAAIVCSNRKL